MKLVGRHLLTAFMKQHADVRGPLRAWVAEVEQAALTGPVDIKTKYPSASFLSDNEVIFNIKGNKYRLVVAINYPYRVCYVRFVGTHQAYDRINVVSV